MLLLPLAAAESPWGVVALALPWGVVNHFGLNVLVSLLSSGDPAVRGAVMGLYSAVTYVAHFIAGAGLGLVYAGMGFTSVAVVAALVLAVAAAMARSADHTVELPSLIPTSSAVIFVKKLPLNTHLYMT